MNPAAKPHRPMILQTTGAESHPLPVTTPEGAGIPSEAVARFLARLEAKRLCMHSVLMLRRGALAVEAYWRPFEERTLHRLYSTSKSVVSVAVGLLVGEGRVRLEDPIVKYFPERAAEKLHPFVAQTTIRDLLLMATPHKYGHCTYTRDDPDWADTYFRTPPTHQPGQIFSYDTTATVMLSILVRRVTGEAFLDYLRPRLLDPLGISREAWCVETPCGHSWGGSGVLFTARDLAKFALCCLNRGRVGDAQIVPESYMAAATSRQIDSAVANSDAEHQFGYGYQFWRTRHNGFACRGMGSQLAVCLPDHDFVLVTLGDTQAIPSGCAVIYDALWEEVLPHLQRQTSLPPNPAAHAALQSRLAVQALLTVPGAAESSTAARVHGRTYVMAENPMGIRTMRFDFEGRVGKFIYENATGRHELSFGFGTHHEQRFPETHYFGVRIGTPYGQGYRCHTSAGWALDDSLVVVCYATDAYLGTLKMNFVFDGPNLTVLMDKNAEWFFDEYVGFASGTWA
jgi:CubicO group peptidase (beta-lactamase class C family)